ncbi:hypothetical protein Slin14017_G116260 [Septoria linicola]|nr:hypothetical protein Slin14017_G116260 [Septoria linicola]
MAPKKQTTTSTRTLRPRNPKPPQAGEDLRGSGDSLAVNIGGVAYSKPSKVAKKPAAKKPKPARLPKNNRTSAESSGKAKERAKDILGAIQRIRNAKLAAFDFAAAVAGGVIVVAEQPEEEEQVSDEGDAKSSSKSTATSKKPADLRHKTKTTSPAGKDRKVSFNQFAREYPIDICQPPSPPTSEKAKLPLSRKSSRAGSSSPSSFGKPSPRFRA